jgi:ATP-dependent exoDNAse (exonuclease V) beta subunit
MTAKLRPAVASRYLDTGRRLCAIRLAGCSPDDLTRNEALELIRDDAEGVRVAYVAATRARDLLVVPAVGDEERDGWLETLNPAIYPPIPRRRSPADGPAHPLGDGDEMKRYPSFRSRDSVLNRPDGEAATHATVSPGLHRLGTHDVVWWDPHALHLDADIHAGLRHGELIRKDVPAEVIEAGLAKYRVWRDRRQQAIDFGSAPSLAVQQVTQRARASSDARLPEVDVVHINALASRPRGRRFGTLVHGVFASVPLDAERSTIEGLAANHARLVGASDEEVSAAASCIVSALAHPLFARARVASAAGRCRREVPVIYRADDGVLLEGAIDLAFEDDSGWMVVDFKTNDASQSSIHRRQIAHYMRAVEHASARPVSGALVYL